MLLLIPAIEIKDGKCVLTPKNDRGVVCSDDPVEMVKLWRKENAKSLHITDVDGAREGYPVNLRLIRELTRAVDIPIELGGGMRTINDIHEAFNSGVYRVTIGTMLLEKPEDAARAIEHYTASKISIGINASQGKVTIHGGQTDSGLTAVSVALNAKQLGFRRVIYKDMINDNGRRVPNFAGIRMLAETIGMRVTASGGVSHLEDLLKLQEMEKLGVDSAIIGHALYENRFSCQAIWRTCEAENYPYTARLSA
ncbi:MAG: 1-(5-phosphoribosyl)-5-[(5-phosphoribosylamino)methylideneamino] imidazole-4-carboxamide isomerase [Ignavibacteriae bacterium]|nr:1-(5-phosphoribosyl)-5-[(5-phosphoribosylamino)methylideneamino] imidazole-4-carboxamide isomerase [Ignavibacteriota bacterium]